MASKTQIRIWFEFDSCASVGGRRHPVIAFQFNGPMEPKEYLVSSLEFDTHEQALAYAESQHANIDQLFEPRIRQRYGNDVELGKATILKNIRGGKKE